MRTTDLEPSLKILLRLSMLLHTIVTILGIFAQKISKFKKIVEPESFNANPISTNQKTFLSRIRYILLLPFSQIISYKIVHSKHMHSTIRIHFYLGTHQMLPTFLILRKRQDDKEKYLSIKFRDISSIRLLFIWASFPGPTRI